jgi:glycosyltransferase involved in cell wall biosynthesis
MRLLRVAYVANDRAGGMSRTLYCTGDELVRRGHEVEYWFADRHPHWRPAPPSLRRFVIPWQTARELRRAVRAGARWDVLEIHEAQASWTVWHRRRLPPVVVFSYGLEDRYHAAFLAYRRAKGRPVSLKQRWSHATISRPAGYAVRHAAHVICSNADDVEHLAARGVSRARLTRHFSGVEPEFLAAGANLVGHPRRHGVLFLGGWGERKGAPDLVPALSELARRFPALPITLAGVGVPAERVLAEFPAEVRPRLHVRSRLEGTAALIELYAQHTVLVLPSFFEGQPLVLIEAAALGLCPVTTHVCGMRDFIAPGRNGLTVPVADPPALLAALGELAANPRRCQTLGEAARQTAQSHTWGAAAENLSCAYHAAASSPRA